MQTLAEIRQVLLSAGSWQEAGAWSNLEAIRCHPQNTISGLEGRLSAPTVPPTHTAVCYRHQQVHKHRMAWTGKVSTGSPRTSMLHSPTVPFEDRPSRGHKPQCKHRHGHVQGTCSARSAGSLATVQAARSWAPTRATQRLKNMVPQSPLARGTRVPHSHANTVSLDI